MMKSILLFLLFSTVAFAQVPLETPTPLGLCDDNNDGFSVFDLTVKTSEILGDLNPVDYQVTFHQTQTDAENGVNPISNPTAYSNIANPQSLFVRVTDVTNATNFGITTLTIAVLPLPAVPQLPDLVLCDDDNDGLQTFPLLFITELITLFDPDYEVSYYETLADAEQQVNAVPDIYTTVSPWTSVIYVRVDNPVGCYVIDSIELIVNPIPEIVQPEDYIIYESPTDETAEFDLASVIPGIIGGTPDLTVTFHLTEGDAQMQANPLPLLYSNVSNPQQLWVSAVNETTQCVAITNFFLRVIDELGIGENESASIGLFPNPTSGIINIQSEQAIDSVAIYDTFGKMVRQISDAGLTRIDISDFPQGLYFLRLTSNATTIVKPVIRR